MGSKIDSPGWKLTLAKEYLLANPSASNSAVVKAIDVSPRTVTDARRQLMEAGLLKPSFYDRTSKSVAAPLPASPQEAPTEPSSSPLQPDDLTKLLAMASADKGEPLTSDEMRQKVSQIVRHAESQQIQLAAIGLLAKLDSMLGAQNRLGPGAPLDEAGRVHRLSLLLDACGLPVVRKALEKAGYEAVVYLKGRLPMHIKEAIALNSVLKGGDEPVQATSSTQSDQSTDAVHRQVD